MSMAHDAMADALINIDNHEIHGQSDPKMAAVVSKNIQWVLERRDAKRYGQRVEHNHTVSADRIITSALELARTAVANVQTAPLIDVTPATPATPAVVQSSEEDDLSDLLS